MLTPPRSRRAAASLPAADSRAADLKRRRFLLSLGASGASVAAVAATALPGVAAAQPAATAAPEHDAGYRETPHVRAYYRSAKL
jgi:hypothetical protein